MYFEAIFYAVDWRYLLAQLVNKVITIRYNVVVFGSILGKIFTVSAGRCGFINGSFSVRTTPAGVSNCGSRSVTVVRGIGNRVRTGLGGLGGFRGGVCSESHCNIILIFRTLSTTNGSDVVTRVFSKVSPIKFAIGGFGRPDGASLDRSCL